MKMSKIVASLFIISTSFFTGCKPKDAELKSNVSAAVANDQVDVDVNDGVVTLSGEVKSPAAREKAEEQARKVEGVHTVNNEVTVLAPPPPPSAQDIADRKLNNEVQAVIAPFPDVNASVDNGVVTLTGRITRPGQMLLMPKIAGLFPRKIENKLVIK
jgi:osmotically-inducible protein OsmY